MNLLHRQKNKRGFTQSVSFRDIAKGNARSASRKSLPCRQAGTAGFTLIELLVVIAIVGILATITLAVLNSARDKARDTEVKGTMEQMRKQAEIYYSIHGNYGNDFSGFCLAAVNSNDDLIYNDSHPETIYPLLVHIMGLLNDNQSSGGVDVACKSAPSPVANQWAVRVPLPSNDAPWCVDASGYAGPASTINSGECVPS